MVQTYLPFASFRKCAQSLDSRRLNKQIIEARQILNIHLNKTKNWSTHPAVRMWRKHLDALRYYINCMISEARNRGLNVEDRRYPVKRKEIKFPWWKGYKQLHYSHQAELIRKLKEHYRPLFNPPRKYLRYGYVWVANLTKKQVRKIKKDPKYYSLKRICAPVSTRPRCKARYKSGVHCGKRCHNAVKEGRYCGTHSRKK